MSLRNVIFGKPEQRCFVDPVIGELRADVRPGHEADWHAWRGRCVVAGQTQPTSFSLYGDGRAPDSALLKEVHRALQARDELRARGGGAFVLAHVSVWEEADDALLLEFVSDGTFAPLEFEWSGHQVRFRPN